MSEDIVYKINLADVLSDQFPDVPEPSESELRQWTVEEIRSYFETASLRENDVVSGTLAGEYNGLFMLLPTGLSDMTLNLQFPCMLLLLLGN